MMTSKRNIYLFIPSLVLILALFPYLTLGPIAFPSEIQPWSALMAWAGGIYYLIRSRLRITRFHFTILAFSFVFMLYVPLSGDVEIGQYIRKSLSFLLSAAILVMAQYLTAARLIKLIGFASLVWFVFAVLGQVAPSVYLSVVPKFVPGALGAYGDRGVTSLSPEATDFGFTMVYFWVLTLVASKTNQKEGKPSAPTWIYIVILLNVFLSKSGSGIFSICLLMMLYLVTYDAKTNSNTFSTKQVLAGFLGLVVVIVIAGSLSETGVRGIDLLLLTLSTPAELLQTTFSYRLAHNLVGIFGLLESNLLGYGAGTFVTDGIQVYDNNNIGAMLGVQGWYQWNIPLTLQDSPLAIFPVILFEYGILGLIFIYIIFYSVLSSQLTLKAVVAGLLFLTWAQSFPAAYPLFWLLLGLAHNPQFCPRLSQKSA